MTDYGVTGTENSGSTARVLNNWQIQNLWFIFIAMAVVSA
jgi:hypothetical protein